MTVYMTVCMTVCPSKKLPYPRDLTISVPMCALLTSVLVKKCPIYASECTSLQLPVTA